VIVLAINPSCLKHIFAAFLCIFLLSFIPILTLFSISFNFLFKEFQLLLFFICCSKQQQHSLIYVALILLSVALVKCCVRQSCFRSLLCSMHVARSSTLTIKKKIEIIKCSFEVEKLSIPKTFMAGGGSKILQNVKLRFITLPTNNYCAVHLFSN